MLVVVLALVSVAIFYSSTIIASVAHGRDWATKQLITIPHYLVCWHATALISHDIYVVTLVPAINVVAWWLMARNGAQAKAELRIMDGHYIDPIQYAIADNAHKPYSFIAFMFKSEAISNICLRYMPIRSTSDENLWQKMRGEARRKIETRIAAFVTAPHFVLYSFLLTIAGNYVAQYKFFFMGV